MAVRKKQKKIGGGTNSFLSSESGTVIKKWVGKIPVCVVFPNSYHVGMSNLATHMLYKKLNNMNDVVCERCFFRGDENPVSLESHRSLLSFAIIFVTLSFELDYINIPKILLASSIHATASERIEKEPIVVAGGICVMSNPEPVHAFFDLFILGDIETTIDPFMEAYRECHRGKRRDIIENLNTFEWVYDPSQLNIFYRNDGTVNNFIPSDFTAAISRYNGKELGSSVIITDKTEFTNMFLIEGTRGCPSRCPFCLIGNLYDFVCDKIDASVTDVPDIGILGGGVSFYPGIAMIAKRLKENGKNIHLPSMRLDEIPLELIFLMKDEVKTLTFGIEAASEQLRRSIGKPFSNEDIFEKIDAILDIKLFNLKLYFMIGLYGENQNDIEAIPELTKKIRHIMMKKGAKRGFTGSITVHVSPFVPKPFTPFQWLPVDDTESLKQKVGWLRGAFGKIDNTYFTHESVKFSFLQGVFARGDRRVSDIIMRLAEGNSLPQVMRESPVNLNFYALRARGKKELFPWDFIKGNTAREALWKRFQAAIKQISSK